MADQVAKRYQKEALPILVKEFNPIRVLFFGSRVKGSATKDSDLDVIVVSSVFQNIKFVKRMPLVLKKVRFPKHVDYLCYTKEEYEKIKDESAIVMDALRHSIEII